jgi:nitrogen fixation NifU-like protein
VSTNLYRELILEHSRNPRNAGRLERPSHHARAANPLCGDELEISLRLEDDRVVEIRAAVRGCIISQAASSLMTTVVQSGSLAEVRAWARAFRGALEDASRTLPPELEPLAPLLGLREHPSRIGCALLSWIALERALDEGPDA